MRRCCILFMVFISVIICAQEYIPMSRIANINYGSSGKGLIWDFSHLEKVTDSELRISYLSSDSSMIRVYDGNTHYNLHCSADSLLIDGYENRLVHASYSEPQIWWQHIGYGDTCRNQNSGSIEYSHQTHGEKDAISVLSPLLEGCISAKS